MYAANDQKETGKTGQGNGDEAKKGNITKGVIDDNCREGGVIERGFEAAAGAIGKHWWMWGQKQGNEKQQMPIVPGEG